MKRNRRNHGWPGYGGLSGSSVHRAYEDLRNEYNAAKNSRFRKRLTGVSSMGSGADYHYRSQADHLKMMELSRSFDRNDPVVGQGITRLIGNVLGDGVKVDPGTSNTDFNARSALLFKEWSSQAQKCHKAREHNLHQIAEMVLRAAIVDGDMDIIPDAEDGSLEPLEAHRKRTPRNTKRNVIHGVLLDEHRKHQEYWYTRDDLNPNQVLIKVSEIQPYRVWDDAGNRQVFTVYDPKRVSQTRGVTALAPIVDMVGMHDDLQFANLVRAQIAACFAVFRERDIQFQPGADDAEGATETETLADGETRVLENIGPGMDIEGAPGVKLSGYSPNIPNPEFFPHAMMVLTFIAVNLNLPVAVLLLDPSQTNFSGWRGAMNQAREGFKRIQKWMIDRFYRPVYLWKLGQFIRDDEELAGLAKGMSDRELLIHRWIPRTWPYIEPKKDVEADVIRVAKNLVSHTDQQAERGRDWEETAPACVADRALIVLNAIETAERINLDHPDAHVNWRELAGFDLKALSALTGRDRVMEDLARAVRAGVPVGVSEARSMGLNLPPKPPEGDNLLRFNDQDILGYHIDSRALTVKDIRDRLALPSVPFENERIGSQRMATVGAGEEKDEGPARQKEEEEIDDDTP